MELHGDLAFRIASGPIGTHGQWTSNALKLKNGWSLASVTFKRTNVDPDGEWDSEPGPTYLAPGTFDLDRTLALPIGSPTGGVFTGQLHLYVDRCMEGCSYIICDTVATLISYENADNTVRLNDPMDLYTRPLMVDLSLDMTLFNDHRATMTIESIILKGPPGRNPKEAFEYGVFDINYWIVKDCNGVDQYPIHFID